jgi:hypothetical protein
LPTIFTQSLQEVPDDSRIAQTGSSGIDSESMQVGWSTAIDHHGRVQGRTRRVYQNGVVMAITGVNTAGAQKITFALNAL